MTGKALAAWARLARRGSLPLAGAFMLLMAACTYYAATNLKVNPDTGSMLDPSLPFQVDARRFRDAFPHLKTDIIVVVRSPSADETTAFISELAASVMEDRTLFTDVLTPAADPFFVRNGLLYLDENSLETAMLELAKSAGVLERLFAHPDPGTLFRVLAEKDMLAEETGEDPDALEKIYGQLVPVALASLEGEHRPFPWTEAFRAGQDPPAPRTALMYVTPVQDYTRLQPAGAALDALHEKTALLKAEYRNRVEVHITGNPALRAEELRSVTAGIGIAMTFSLVAVTALLLLCYRSWKMTLATFCALLLSLSVTAALAARFAGELNLVSVAFTVLLTGLGLDFSIHLLLNIRAHRSSGKNEKQALDSALYETGPALALAAPTTALAFLSFVPTAFDGIAQLGIISAIGVMTAFFVSVTFLPAIPDLTGSGTRFRQDRIHAAFTATGKHARPLAVIVVATAMAGLFVLPQVRFDADQMSLRDPQSPSVTGFNILFEDPDTVPYRLSRLAASYEEVRETARRLEHLDSVASVRSLYTFIPENQEMKGDLVDMSAGTLAFAGSDTGQTTSTREGMKMLAGQLYRSSGGGAATELAGILTRLLLPEHENRLPLLEKNLFSYWPQFADRLRMQLQPEYIDPETLPVSIRTRYITDDGLLRVDIIPSADVRDQVTLEAFVLEVGNIHEDITGGAYQALEAGKAVSEAMLRATLTAIAVTALFMWLFTGKIRTVILILLPLVLAAVLTAEAGVLLGIPFNYANIIVLPLLIGIGVDSGIHLVMRHRQQQTERDRSSIYDTCTPRAVVFSGLTTMASFGSLALSPHPGTASMGALLLTGITCTLVCSVIVLPALFGHKRKNTP